MSAVRRCVQVKNEEQQLLTRLTTSHCFSFSSLPSSIMASLLTFLIIISLTCSVTSVETKANFDVNTCTLLVNNTKYNLSSLVRNDGDQPWQLNTKMVINLRKPFSSHQHVFINLCRPLPKTSPTFPSGGCGPSGAVNSSVCLVDLSTNVTSSLADYNNITVSYDNNQEAILFKFFGVNITIQIFIHCSPSVVDNQPLLISSSANDWAEKWIIDWYHASGCPKEDAIGDNCQVSVPSIGKSFDLSPLRRSGGYDFPEQGYDYYINICGPINRSECADQSGICHFSKHGKMHYSLGKWSDKISYSDGILKLVYADGDPYRDPAKTPRKTIILFLCNITAGEGQPEFVEETNQTYVIHWQTKYACPKAIPTVNCVWKNSTHRIDLTPLQNSKGNHFFYTTRYLGVINICSPINQGNVRGMQKPRCSINSGVCVSKLTDVNEIHNLGQPKNPPLWLFDNQIHLIYEDGDLCPGTGLYNLSSTLSSTIVSHSSPRYTTDVTFICDPSAGLGEPALIYGSSSNCLWKIEWKTSLVCKARPIYAHQCIFEDKLNGIKIDLTQVFKSVPIISEQNGPAVKSFFINICSESKTASAKEMEMSKKCVNSSVCMEEKTSLEGNGTYLSLGDLKASEYNFQGESLTLRFFNGSPCDTNQTWESEIDIRCSNNFRTTYLGRKTDKCLETFFFESHDVCGLKPPTCTYRINDRLIDLRELSSLTHAWKVNASTTIGKIYYFNICNKIPDKSIAGDGHSAVVECNLIDGKQYCSSSLGKKETMKMTMEPSTFDSKKKDLVISYTNARSNVCSHLNNVTTKIYLICDHLGHQPVFVKKLDTPTSCEYHFKWETYLACFSGDPERYELKLQQKGVYFFDQRPELLIDNVVDISALYNTTFKVSDGKYEYTFDFGGIDSSKKANCKNAALCQREINSTFERDIGSIETATMIVQGRKIKLKLTATNHQKCGKNASKNVTSSIFFECNNENGIGSPKFFYESNNCDYIFIWSTDIVCPKKLLPSAEVIAKLQEADSQGKGIGFFANDGPATASLFGALFIVLGIITCAILPLAWVVFRLSDREKRNYLVHWIRSKLQTPVITSFHYSQVSSDSTKLVSMNDDL